MIAVKAVSINGTVFPSIAEADLYVATLAERYEYQIVWADGTKHLSRSRAPSVTFALRDWIDHFTLMAQDRKIPMDRGIAEHLRRLSDELVSR